LIVVGILLINSSAFSQTVSSYSSIGIGDVIKPIFVNSQGNGGVAISISETWYINQANPALLPYNVFTIFQTGVGYESKTVRQQGLKDGYSSTSLLYLGTAIPAKSGKWTFSFGIQPYSRVNYKYLIQEDIPASGGSVSITQAGKGGFNEAYFSNGIRLYKNLTIGVKASYIFSSIIKESTYQVTDSLSPTLTERTLYRRTNASDIMFSAGIAYRHTLKNKTSINYGATYDPQTSLRVRRFDRLDLRSSAGAVLFADTLSDETLGSIKIPQKFGFGISINNAQKWTIGIDFDYQSWSKFRNFEGSNENLSNGFSFRLGGQLTPDIQDPDKYLKRITYRFGVNYDRLPYTIGSENINDFGINFGWSLPVSRVSSLDFALKYGIRGTQNNNLVKENYFQVHLGFTLNDRWFIRRVYD